MPWRQHIRHWRQFNKYGLTKKDVHGASTRTIKNVVLAGIHTLPQEAVCAGVAIREAIHMRKYIMDCNPFTQNDLELLIHQTAADN